MGVDHDHLAHLVRDNADVFNLEHVSMKAFQVRRHHHFVADQAGLVGAALFSHSRRQLLAKAVIAASRVSAYPRAALARRT